jgi:cytochrome c oxidase cbb3-type subunit 1
MNASSSSLQTVSAPVSLESEPVWATTSDIYQSCRVPVMLLLMASIAWLALGTLLCVISSIKLHGAGFLAGNAWLTYGRVRPAFYDVLVYGFASQAALAVALWMLARLGRNVLQGLVSSPLPGFSGIWVSRWVGGNSGRRQHRL